ncbi:Leucine_rich repeats-containing protein [Hexamita inflata]|uniref:Leucine rich repeats-containing protein n=1 Tax=Hexamita inflata TaxID=28002 RepID=A0AA86TRW0_9EUKA|nr:Leucine rich repeats-containing protein [Hexamita inflata]
MQKHEQVNSINTNQNYNRKQDNSKQYLNEIQICGQENVIHWVQFLYDEMPQKLSFFDIQNYPKLVNSSVQEILINNNSVQCSKLLVQLQLNIKNEEIITFEECQFSNLKVLRLKNKIHCCQLDLNQIQNLAKYSELQELSIENYNCTIKDASALQFLATVQKLDLINTGLANLDILRPCRNLKECNIINENIDLSRRQMELKDGNMTIKQFNQLLTLDVIQTMFINKLVIKDCQQLTTIVSSRSLNELVITINVLKQINLINFDNLKVLIIINNPDLFQNILLNSEVRIYVKTYQLSNIYLFNFNQLRLLKQLTKIQINYCSLGNIDVFRGFKNLKELNLANNNIVYLDPLEKLTQLTYLDVSNNYIQDFTVLKEHSNFKRYIFGVQNNISVKIMKYTNKIRIIYLATTELNNMIDQRVAFKQRFKNIKQQVKQMQQQHVSSFTSITYSVIQIFQYLNNFDFSQ